VEASPGCVAIFNLNGVEHEVHQHVLDLVGINVNLAEILMVEFDHLDLVLPKAGRHVHPARIAVNQVIHHQTFQGEKRDFQLLGSLMVRMPNV
jgi:hypothetical protein